MRARPLRALLVIAFVGACSGPAATGTGGPGATSFTTGLDAQHNMGRALRSWVEQDRAPERVIAVKFRAKTPDSGIAMSRPLCVWPKLPAYKGSGDTNDAASFICR
jgi:feruloyl esterase